MLPNESLLVVLHFADYRTLVLAKLASARFLRVVAKYAAELACRRSFQVVFYTKWIRLSDMTIDASLDSIGYVPGNPPSLATACRELDAAIGPHRVAKLEFDGNTWNMHGVGDVFEAAPALKYAEAVGLFSLSGSTDVNDSEAFMRNFAETKSLLLSVHCDVFRQFSWTFLRRESARELRLIKVAVSPPYDICRSIEELVLYCVSLPRLLDGEPLEVDFSEHYFSEPFVPRIIELLKDTRRELTFRMNTVGNGGELLLDESDYAIDVEGTTTRYASEESGIVVEVKGRSYHHPEHCGGGASKEAKDERRSAARDVFRRIVIISLI